MRVNSVLGLILCIKFLYIGIVSELLVWVDYPYVQNISDYRLPLHIAFWKINLRQSKAFVAKSNLSCSDLDLVCLHPFK